MNATTDIFEMMTRLEASGETFVCVTLVEARGSVPQEVGAKMLVTASGRACGTIGGGRVEKAALKRAGELIICGSAIPCEIIEWNLQRDIGMTCGGVVKYLFEVFRFSCITC